MMTTHSHFLFSHLEADRTADFQKKLAGLSASHKLNCPSYRTLTKGLGTDLPLLPVSVFKDADLFSVPEEEIRLQLTSSGTSGQRPSRIYLDGKTSAAQQKALIDIASDFIGNERRPMLIIDSSDLFKNRSKFSARGAAVLGFSVFSTHRYFALDENMNLNYDGIRSFLDAVRRYRDEPDPRGERSAEAEADPPLLFGFTYIVWKYFCEALAACDEHFDFSDCCLIHGGGWKKMQDIAVSNETFKARLKDVCALKKIYNYYGMVEQTGSIFMECECGHLHVSELSDIHILRPEDFSECEPGEYGLIALSSLLPASYPGHHILTEDLGTITGIDDCPCGRKGKTFRIAGRVTKAEIRGCSDTLQDDRAATKDLPGSTRTIVEAGTMPPAAEASLEVFSPLAVSFLTALSDAIRSDVNRRSHPDALAFAFWCRKSALEALKKRYAGLLPHGAGSMAGAHGKGLTFHLAPSNMPAMFAYSFAVSLLAGNPNIVRISEKDAPETDYLLDKIRTIMERPSFRQLKAMNAFLRFPHDDACLREIFRDCKVRVLWGSSETIDRITAIPAGRMTGTGNSECTDIIFPSRTSIAVIDARTVSRLQEDELELLAARYFRDTYEADQNACSSPVTNFWVCGGINAEEAALSRYRFYSALAKIAEGYTEDAWRAVEKYRRLCLLYLNDTEGRFLPADRWKNNLYSIPVQVLPARLGELEGKFGSFYDYQINDLEDLLPWMNEDVQTAVVEGIDAAAFRTLLDKSGAKGVDRIVPIGDALVFDTVWDRKDLIRLLSVSE
ncbi:MAG: acyl-CoA reductase [Eubacterium sp.]|nr:acyl-CoA reductase [Eubacterium sp.]